MKNSLTLQSLNHLFYTLKWVKYNQGEYIFKEYDNSDMIVIITSGMCEVYTIFEGNEFILEYLSVGSVINQNNFFLEDLIYTYIRCKTGVSTQILTREGFESICNDHEHFKIQS